MIFASGFVESNYLDWENATGPNSHLYAPLLVYPISNRWYPMPYKLDDRAKNDFDQLLDGQLSGRPRIFLLAYQPSELTSWLTQRLEDRRYHMHWKSPDSIVLLQFDASETGTLRPLNRRQ